MSDNILVKDAEKYSGQYVATKSFTDKEVVTSGSDPVQVIKDAKSKGADDPVVFFVPEKDVVQIY